MLQSCIIAFAMYSKIPMPKIEWGKKPMRYALCFFPFVGVMIGLFIFLWGKFSLQLGLEKNLYCSVFVAIPVLLTGGIHIDGYLDTIDALHSYQSKERKLEILKDPHTGAFAIIFCTLYFILQFGIWSQVNETTLALLSISFVLSRTLSGLSVVTFPLAKNSGLAANFASQADKKGVRVILSFYFFILMIILLLFNCKLGALCLLSSILVYYYYKNMAIKQFGGLTGDLAGYFLQLVELVMAFVVVIGGVILI